MNIRASVLILILTLSSVAQAAAHPSGTFAAPFELFEGHQIKAISIELDGSGGYVLVRDPNTCRFEPLGPLVCTEIAPLQQQGSLELRKRDGAFDVYSLSGVPEVQLVVAWMKASRVEAL